MTLRILALLMATLTVHPDGRREWRTRDGRVLGRDCNPCPEEPEPGYVAPPVPASDLKTMVGTCSPGAPKPQPAYCTAAQGLLYRLRVHPPAKKAPK